MGKENSTFNIGSRMLCMPRYLTENYRRERRNGNGQKLHLFELPLGKIVFADFLPSGNGIGPEHLAEALRYMQTPPNRLIVNAPNPERQKLLAGCFKLLDTNHVPYITLSIDGDSKKQINLSTLIQITETWRVPFFLDIGTTVSAEILRLMREINTPAWLGIFDPGLVFQKDIHEQDFQVMTL